MARPTHLNGPLDESFLHALEVSIGPILRRRPLLTDKTVPHRAHAAERRLIQRAAYPRSVANLTHDFVTHDFGWESSLSIGVVLNTDLMYYELEYLEPGEKLQ